MCCPEGAKNLEENSLFSMLKKSLRLKKRDIELFFKKKTQYLRGGFVYMRYTKNNTTKNRFAFVVSGPKKSAAARNLTRRRMSEIIKEHEVKIKGGFDIILFIKLIEKKSPKYEALKKDINYVLSHTVL